MHFFEEEKSMVCIAFCKIQNIQKSPNVKSKDSVMGYFCTKLRNRMSDNVLDALVFLRQYYKNLDKNE